MNLKDQKRAVRFLEKLHTGGRLPGALLLYGPPGVGKTTCALDFSKGVLCTENVPWGCGSCKSCEHMEPITKHILEGEWEEISLVEEKDGKKVFLYLSGEHPDFVFVPPSGSSIKIDQIRAVKEFSYRKPALSPRKVVLIDEAHTMTKESANALLKVLEEPPAHTHFILVSRDKEALLPTVLSRTYQIGFPPLDRETFFNLLGKEDERLYKMSGGSLTTAKMLRERKEVVKLVDNFISLDPLKVFSCAQEVEKLETQDKLLFIDLLEGELKRTFLEGGLDYDRFDMLSRRIGELREGMRRGLKLSLALASLYSLWR